MSILFPKIPETKDNALEGGGGDTKLHPEGWMKKNQVAVVGPCFLCDPQMRDPLSVAMSFMSDVSRLRIACKFTFMSFNHALYLEGELPSCGYLACRVGPKSYSGNLQLLLPPLVVNCEEDGDEEGDVEWKGNQSPHRAEQRVVAQGTTPRAPRPVNQCNPPPAESPRDIFFPIRKIQAIDKPVRLHILNDQASTIGFGKGVRHVVIDHTLSIAPPKGHEGSGQSIMVIHEGRPGILNRMLSCNDDLECATLKRLPKVTSLGTLLHACASLHTVEVVSGAFSELTSLDQGLESCRKLQEVRILPPPTDTNSLLPQADSKNNPHHLVSAFPKLRDAGSGFLSDCTSLREITIFSSTKDCSSPCHFPLLATVKDRWMRGCKNLVIIRVAGLHQLRAIGEECLYGCVKLKEAIFEDLPELTKVASGWLALCTSLEEFHLKRLPALKTIGGRFLSNCSKLQRVSLIDLPTFQRFELDRTLCNCQDLVSVHFEDLPSILDVGNNFMTGFDMPKPEKVVTYGKNVLNKIKGTKW